jgi:hypothetical protein
MCGDGAHSKGIPSFGVHLVVRLLCVPLAQESLHGKDFEDRFPDQTLALTLVKKRSCCSSD